MTRRVLLVDDEPDIREIAALALATLHGWQVAQAGSAGEAVDVARTFRPDVVVLDVMMPGQDGPATLGLLRADAAAADVPVVFLTAKSQRHELEELLALGAAGVLAKPFDPMTLGQQLSETLGWTG